MTVGINLRLMRTVRGGCDRHPRGLPWRQRNPEKRGLISPGKGRDPLTITWRLKKKGVRSPSQLLKSGIYSCNV
jgi:hypothetical protein